MSGRFLVSWALALALTACGSSVQPADMALAQQQCAPHGGVESVARFERGLQLVIHCVSGLQIDIRRHNEKAKAGTDGGER